MDDATWKRIEEYCLQQYGAVPDEYRLLATYLPAAVEGVIATRQALTRTPPDGALPQKIRELIMVAVEIALLKPPILHARRAIDAGATVAELAEVVGICLYLAGMASYVVAGYPALKAAEEQEREAHGIHYTRGM
jgi:alkylhydroperoxidase/carboxymuconolactone decarboxylase family protein YurZ